MSDEQRRAFETALSELGKPDDDFDTWHLDEGSLYWLFGKAWQAALSSPQGGEVEAKLRNVILAHLVSARENCDALVSEIIRLTLRSTQAADTTKQEQQHDTH